MSRLSPSNWLRVLGCSTGYPSSTASMYGWHLFHWYRMPAMPEVRNRQSSCLLTQSRQTAGQWLLWPKSQKKKCSYIQWEESYCNAVVSCSAPADLCCGSAVVSWCQFTRDVTSRTVTHPDSIWSWCICSVDWSKTRRETYFHRLILVCVLRSIVHAVSGMKECSE